jgi:hypothetical protein
MTARQDCSFARKEEESSALRSLPSSVPLARRTASDVVQSGISSGARGEPRSALCGVLTHHTESA